MDELEYWISRSELDSLFTSDYWNDLEEERKKEWWIDDDNDKKLLRYLEKEGLNEEFQLAVSNANIKGNVLDLAAGTCWTSAYLSQIEDVKQIDAVEFSYHRIQDLAPKTISLLKGNKNKIKRVLGSFYDIKRDNESYDVIVLSQAYHHAQYPLKLFHECDRVLKKGGVILIIGEHIIGKKRVFRRFIKNLLKGKLLLDIHEEFYNHDDPLGDHSYLLSDYMFTFYSYGYDYKVIKSNIRDSTIFIGIKQ